MSGSPSDHIKNAKLGTQEVKNKILRYLYSSHINLNIKYEPIINQNDLDNIRDNDYIICPRFSGTRSWIIFFHTGNNYYAVNFPKHSQTKKEELIIHSVDIRVSKEFYRGTIMEGIFFRMNEKKYLVIDEVYILAGENQLLKSKDDRLNNLTQFIKLSTNINPIYYMYVSQYFNINKKSLRDLYEKIKMDTKIQELIFYPKTYGKKIYNYTIVDIDLKDNIIKLVKFRMQKTANIDVYNLLSINDNKKIGIAYIPDMETSKKCRQWYKDNKVKELIVKCQMNMDKKKWVPLELVEKDLDDENLSEKSDSDDDDDGNDNNVSDIETIEI